MRNVFLYVVCTIINGEAVTASAYGNGFELKDAVKQADEYAYDAN